MLHIKFLHLCQVDLKKKVSEKFSMHLCISIVQNWDSLAQSHLEPWDLCLNKLGKGPLGNASEPSGSEEEDF